MHKIEKYLTGTCFHTLDADPITGEKRASDFVTGSHYLATHEVKKIIELIKASPEVKAYVLGNLTFDERLTMSKEEDMY
jgi:hypothetical protein